MGTPASSLQTFAQSWTRISHQRTTIMLLYVSIVLIVVLVNHSYVESIRLPTAAVAKAAYLTDHRKVTVRTKIASIVPDGAKNGLASALAAAVVKFALQPFDTLKTIQQMEKGNIGLLKTAVAFIETRGILSLWSGVGVALIGSVPSVAVYFGVYNAAKSRLAAALPDRYRSVAVALAASIANTIASVIRAPNEVLKSRMQMGLHPNLLSAITYSIREEGVLGLFSTGKLASQILRDVPYAVIIAVSYELLQGAINRHRALSVSISRESGETSDVRKGEKDSVSGSGVVLPTIIGRSTADNSAEKHTLRVKNIPLTAKQRTSQDALCGSIAGGLSTLLTTPMDVVKTRLMSGGSQYKYTSISNAVYSIAHEEGISAFFKGTSSRLMHKIPANALFYVFYEAFRTLLGVEEKYK